MSGSKHFSRELSWLEFNARVLDQALDRSLPLLERLKFLGIVSSNFDEFFMVRIAALKAAIRSGKAMEEGPTGAPEALLATVTRRARELVEAQYECLLGEILPGLEKEGLKLARPAEWSHAERRWLERYFSEQVYPLLTPLRVEGARFPSTGNLRIHVAFLLEQEEPDGTAGPQAPPDTDSVVTGTQQIAPDRIDRSIPVQSVDGGEDSVQDFLTRSKDRIESPTAAGSASASPVPPEACGSYQLRCAIVQVPPALPRFVRLETKAQPGHARFALLEDIVETMGHHIFPGQKVARSLIFRITRDADSPVDEERDTDFLAALEDVLVGRQSSLPVRLVVSGRSKTLISKLREGLGLAEEDVYRIPGPVDLRGFTEWAGQDGLMASVARLRDRPWHPVRLPEPADPSAFWASLRSRDRVIHLPYESFAPILRFIETAADDPSVLAIKMTLYRTSDDSPIIRALARAAQARKQVCVLVELKARFDEERNIGWATRLEQAGAIVVYGIARLKVHAKATLVIRRESDGDIGRYLHLSTGNYNERTARLYADISLMTANPALCAEASQFFNAITGYSSAQRLSLLAVAPFDLKARLVAMIEREIQRSSRESPGLIMAKMNALADPVIVEALYRASQAGVRVRLNVRGVCTLVPGIPGLSENIEVTSLLGRYLEHARIVYFLNGGAGELYLSSADWMPRNLDRRVELLFPVLDEAARRRIFGILEDCLRDTTRSYRLLPSGHWMSIRPAEGAPPFHAQASFYEREVRMKELAEAPPEELEVRRL